MSLEVGELFIAVPAPLYLNITAEWLSGDRNQPMAWSTANNSNLIYHWAALESPAEFTENLNQAEWGTLYYVCHEECE
jgi:hypothetical protein